MSEDEREGHLQTGIILGKVLAEIERLQRSSDHYGDQFVHVLGVLSTMAAEISDIKTRQADDERRPRMGSITTEHMVAKVVDEANARQSEKNSESIRVAALEAAKVSTEPVVAATISQTKIVKDGLKNQTKWLAIASSFGWILYYIAQGIWQALQHATH